MSGHHSRWGFPEDPSDLPTFGQRPPSPGRTASFGKPLPVMDRPARGRPGATGTMSFFILLFLRLFLIHDVST